MQSRDFCYWLQGFFELAEPGTLTKAQCRAIQNHLAMVFAHEIDPSHGTPEHRDTLQDIHDDVKPSDEDRAKKIEDFLNKEVPRSGHSCPHDVKLMC